MTRTDQPATGHIPRVSVDNAPLTRSKVAGALAVLACAVCCALPFLIAAGGITGAAAAILQQTLLAASAALATAALAMWWLHRRRRDRQPVSPASPAG